jgi:hypothetical protein
MNETTPSVSPTSASSRLQPTHDEIARRAQDLWEKYGRPSGRDQEIWFEAERSLQLATSGSEPPVSASAVMPPSPAPARSEPARATPAPGKKSARGGRATAR